MRNTRESNVASTNSTHPFRGSVLSTSCMLGTVPEIRNTVMNKTDKTLRPHEADLAVWSQASEINIQSYLSDGGGDGPW